VPARLELENSFAVVATDVPGRENGVGLDLEDFEVGRPSDDVLELLLAEDAVAEVNFLDIETWWWMVMLSCGCHVIMWLSCYHVGCAKSCGLCQNYVGYAKISCGLCQIIRVMP
jgi:hypothetical protein